MRTRPRTASRSTTRPATCAPAEQTSSCTFNTAGTFTYDDPTSTDPVFGGKITVAAAAQRSVTLAANRNIAIFGDSVTLSGTTSAKTAGETVTVIARPSGEPAARIDVTTATGGAWSLRVQPRVHTEYQVQYGSALSGKLAVSVRPRITLQKVGADKFLVVVLTNKSLAGKTAQLTRFVGGSWSPVGDIALTSITRTDSLAVKTVTSFVPRGTKLRVVMSDDQTGRRLHGRPEQLRHQVAPQHERAAAGGVPAAAPSSVSACERAVRAV